MSYSLWAAKIRASSWDIFLRLNVIHLYQKTFSGWNEKYIWLDAKVLQRTIIDNTKYACNHNFKYHSWRCALIGLQLLSEQLKYINFISKLCFHCRYVYAWSKGSILLGVLKPIWILWLSGSYLANFSSVSFRFLGGLIPNF